MRKKKPEKEVNNERWMLTYLDMITLLMAFFVVMYASSTADKVKMAKVAASISSAFGTSGKSVIGDESAVNVKQNQDLQEASKSGAGSVDAAEKAEENKLKEIKQKVDAYVKQNGMAGQISTALQERGLTIHIVDTTMFDTGKDDLLPGSEEKLVAIGKILKTTSNMIRVEGHTDSRPMHSDKIPSNVELSVLRASCVWHVLEEKGGVPRKQIIAAGYADNDPIVPDDSEANMAKNRRVDIVVINSKYSSVDSNQAQTSSN